MRKIESLKEVNNEYKYIIGLTPQDARVLNTSLKLLPPVALNQEEIQTLIKAVSDVANADKNGAVTFKESLNPVPGTDTIVDEMFNSNPTCDVCED